MWDQKECDLYFEDKYQNEEEELDELLEGLDAMELEYDYSDEIEEIREQWGIAC